MDTTVSRPAQPEGIASNRPSRMRRLLQVVPMTLAIAALGGIAYWGHRTGWSFTERTEDNGPQTPSEAVSSRPVVRLSPAGRNDASAVSGQRIQIVFDSAGAVEAAGIDIASVWPTELIEQVVGAGEVRFDPARVARR